jgi:luciferase family oxidoreductase group 1
MHAALSLLDRSRTRAGEDDATALRGTVARAVAAERLGYDRFWVAEHHGVPGVAGAAPAVLLAAIAGATSSIRLGSAGVMLPHHQPLVVAEQFATLTAFAPGRIDLGVGRSPGFTRPVRQALRSDLVRDFAEDLAELRDHLTGSAEITAHPRPDGVVPMYVLATDRGLTVAAELGLPVIVGGPLLGVTGDPTPGLEALAGYRNDFRPSGWPSASTSWSPGARRTPGTCCCRRPGRWRRPGPPGRSRRCSRWRRSARYR